MLSVGSDAHSKIRKAGMSFNAFHIYYKSTYSYIRRGLFNMGSTSPVETIEMMTNHKIYSIMFNTRFPQLLKITIFFIFSSLKRISSGRHHKIGILKEYTPWASYQIRKIAGCACAGNAGNVFPRRRFQRKPLISDPGMHHGTCVTHVPWCMSGSLTCGNGENVPGIPGACAPANLRIWQEAHYWKRTKQ